MSKGLLVDSDVLIDFLRGEEKAVRFFQAVQDTITFSVVSVAEIYSGIRGSEAEVVDQLFASFPVLPVTAEIARMAGTMRGLFRASHAVEIPDALIAATCETNNLELITLNKKHFPMFPELKPPYTK